MKLKISIAAMAAATVFAAHPTFAAESSVYFRTGPHAFGLSASATPPVPVQTDEDSSKWNTSWRNASGESAKNSANQWGYCADDVLPSPYYGDCDHDGVGNMVLNSNGTAGTQDTDDRWSASWKDQAAAYFRGPNLAVGDLYAPTENGGTTYVPNTPVHSFPKSLTTRSGGTIKITGTSSNGSLGFKVCDTSSECAGSGGTFTTEATIRSGQFWVVRHPGIRPDRNASETGQVYIYDSSFSTKPVTFNVHLSQ